MKFVKEYGWKENARYYILLPKWLLRGLKGVLRGHHTLNDMSAMQFFGLMRGCCDAEAGRMYRMEDI